MGSDLIGRKPLAFCVWLFELLGAQPGDELVDLYPGSGQVGHAWTAFASSEYSSDMSLRATRRGRRRTNVSLVDELDAFAAGDADASLVDELDVSSGSSGDTSPEQRKRPEKPRGVGSLGPSRC